ncbi:xanthine dehydrogenase family protein molybdopterin-binding subunit [Neisseriaceae bacterium JH1-16]|nr:xanthine dehydrogenase family protein molybdopterin-binding subunit [Neisseriaceae bacterium JH1-16]
MDIANRSGSSPSTEAEIINVSRRHFIQGVGGLALGLYLGPVLAAAAKHGAASFEPNAFVRIAPDGTVTVIAKHVEVGQGTYTGLATLVAEELDADWSRVRVEGAPADASRYKNLFYGAQVTGGSTAMANSFEQMRKAGATARAMLVSAAARQWKVSPDSLTVSNGVVHHAASGRQAGFGQLAAAAARLPVPSEVKLKDPKDFILIGKLNVPRKDSTDKTDGRALFTQDVKLPGMLVAIVAHPPRFGATVKSVDASKAQEIPGVVAVVPYAGTAHTFGGVAVLAKNTWVAKKGRDALDVQWDDSQSFKLGSDEILAQYRQMASRPGQVARQAGDVDAAFAKPARLIEADYAFPYLAHAAMEPMNCLVRLEDGRCEIWNGEQAQTIDQFALAKQLGLAPEKISITQLYAGGSFGRRASTFSDYLSEAVAVAQAAAKQGVNAPIKLVWTREEDTRGGYYRPLFFHRARLSLDPAGKLVGWHQHLVGQSILTGTPLEQFGVKDGIDSVSVEGAGEPYDIPNRRIELSTPLASGVPVLWFRSVGHTHTAFATETLIDEAAVAAGKDPVEFRRPLLAKHPRHWGVLQLAAEKAGWGTKLAPGAAGERRGRGIAVHESFNSYVAQVAEVTVKPDGSFKVDRVVCAVDCGLAINPDVIKAQMEGGIGFGLAAALHGAITLKDGVVEQSNFHDYQVLRINEMPAVEVHIVPSAEKPTGVGEPGVPPIAPAVANAVFAATGHRIRTLPFGEQLKS